MACRFLLLFFFVPCLTVNYGQSENIYQDTIAAQLKRHGFNILIQHLNEVDLMPLLASQGGPFTIFAPTDEAFKSLNPEIIRSIVFNNDWVNIVRHGIARQIIPESSIRDGMVLSDGLAPDFPITFNVNHDKVAVVNKIARIIGKIEASNGIIYPIDALLIKTIPDVLKLFDYGNFANGTFTVFEKAVDISGLTAMLEDPKELLTLFVPTDDAFNQLGEDTIKDLLSNPEKMRKLLLDQYIVSGLISAEQLMEKSYINTIGGERLLVQKTSVGIKVGAGTITFPDKFSYNGLFHVIDKVQPI